MKHLFEERRFLNENGFHSTAAICITINDDEGEYANFSPIEVDFSMSDCNRTISLSLDTSSEDELDNSLFKLQQIEEVCRKAKIALDKTRAAIRGFESRKNNAAKKQENI